MSSEKEKVELKKNFEKELNYELTEAKERLTSAYIKKQYLKNQIWKTKVLNDVYTGKRYNVMGQENKQK